MQVLIDGLTVGFVISAGIYMSLTAIGAAIKTVSWLGKRLGIKPYDCP